MGVPTWQARFFETTRGRILGLLRRGDATVADLAERLELTDNAIRTHLAALERDDLVEQHGVQRGIGKPAYLYRLTDEADRLFPKAYALVLGALIDRLHSRLGEIEAREVLEEVGRSLADATDRPTGSPRERVEAAVTTLQSLGGLIEVEDRSEGFFLRGYTCPLTDVTADHPNICQLATALLQEMTGLPVREECDRAGRPMCRFVIARPAAG